MLLSNRRHMTSVHIRKFGLIVSSTHPGLYLAGVAQSLNQRHGQLLIATTV